MLFFIGKNCGGGSPFDPRIGRFITKDPLGMADGPNLYLYVNNNPVNWIDPWGLDKEKTEQELWNELYELDELGGLTQEQQKRYDELIDEITNREAIQPIPLWKDPIFWILTGFRWKGTLAEPVHFGFDVPFTKWNIIHFGRHVKWGRHIAIWFKEAMKAKWHIPLP